MPKKRTGRNPHVCILVMTHGSEPIGREAVRHLNADPLQRTRFDWIIGNPRAAREQKRFIERDLNTVAPGKRRAATYEERRASVICKQLSAYNVVLDIHQTVANDRTVLILPAPNRATLAYAAQIEIPDVLIWPEPPQKKTGALVAYARSGIGIEVGVRSGGERPLKKLIQILQATLPQLQTPPPTCSEEDLKKKRFYYVFDQLTKEESLNISVPDFEKVQHRGEEFYVLRIGQGDGQGIPGYKMRKCTIKEILENS